MGGATAGPGPHHRSHHIHGIVGKELALVTKQVTDTPYLKGGASTGLVIAPPLATASAASYHASNACERTNPLHPSSTMITAVDRTSYDTSLYWSTFSAKTLFSLSLSDDIHCHHLTTKNRSTVV